MKNVQGLYIILESFMSSKYNHVNYLCHCFLFSCKKECFWNLNDNVVIIYYR